MSNYNTYSKTVKHFYSDCEIIPRYLLKNEFCFDGEWRRLTGNEILLAVTILRYVALSENTNTPGSHYRLEDGTPFCRVSIETLSKETGQSVRTVKKNRKNLQEVGIISIKRQQGHQPDVVFINDTKTLNMRKIVFEESTSSDKECTQNSSEPLDQTQGCKNGNFRGAEIASQGCKNCTLFTKSIFNKRINHIESNTSVDGNPPSTLLSVKTENEQIDPAPTRAETSSNNTTESEGHIESSSEITSLSNAKHSSSQGEGFTTTAPTDECNNRSENCRPMGKINFSLNYDEFKIIVSELMSESACECTDSLCNDILNVISDMSHENGYPDPTEKYVMNPQVIAKAMVRCGIERGYVYQGLFVLNGGQNPRTSSPNAEYRGSSYLSLCH